VVGRGKDLRGGGEKGGGGGGLKGKGGFFRAVFINLFSLSKTKKRIKKEYKI